jgi:predicted nucleic acid-binding protein
MTAAFADTFYWAALTHPAEQYHRLALAFAADFERSGRIVTTEDVLAEYLNMFSTKGAYWRGRAVAVVENLRNLSHLAVVPLSSRGFAGGLELYAARPDKRYSLTDCISMQIMRREGIADVLTHDRHFEQEGFRALFSQQPR